MIVEMIHHQKLGRPSRRRSCFQRALDCLVIPRTKDSEWGLRSTLFLSSTHPRYIHSGAIREAAHHAKCASWLRVVTSEAWVFLQAVDHTAETLEICTARMPSDITLFFLPLLRQH